MKDYQIFQVVIAQIVRHFLTTAAGALAAYGVTADQQTALVSTTTAIVSAAAIFVAVQLWSWAAKRWAILYQLPQ
jgi:hypothetical protein